mmetsp:Transcript_66994/g.132086  ORF Transcript_66994/g.132086 Transcript_66994/m.132086 type:complete len:134 (+) Transcript_66994:71-472(+)|eukprot:CAMPEP_0172725412 /NCGR_PEP_ID=MMETSP1074-20121228/88315_1 /TAXON_ID=2916 /ORGANISM="Ceratium fusus, Strain PA161109" /LENGTH=133 /DNA_ID=CAMNT_0013552175 /DNA_START=76 /DNA_END=477 /DNA_ORIENTATION=-
MNSEGGGNQEGVSDDAPAMPVEAEGCGFGKGKKGGKGKGGKGKGKGKGKGFSFRKGFGYKGGGKADVFYGADSGDRLRPPCTETEKKEAHTVVVKAQLAAAQREAMKKQLAAVQVADKETLQAMINARLPKKE